MRIAASWRLAGLAISLALVLCSVLVPAGLAAPEGGSPIALVVRTPSYHLTATSLSVPDYATEDAPGRPQLPVYGTLVELPATGAWTVTYQARGSRILDQHVALPAVPVPQLSLAGPSSWTQRPQSALPATVPVVDQPDPTVYRTNDFSPTALVTAGAVVWQNGKRLLPLRVYPFQYNPVAGQVYYHPEIHIQITLAPAPAAAPAALPPAPAPQPLAAGSGTLRIRTAAAGMVRLTYADLTAHGVPLATTDSDSFALTGLGQPVALQVQDPNANHRLDPGELVIFYAEAPTSRYNLQNVYFFTYGAAAGTRMTLRTVMPTGAEPVLTTIIRTARVEQDSAYYSDYSLPTTADHFFDGPASVTTATPVSQLSYDLNLIDPLTTGAVAFRGRFYGGKAVQTANPDQALRVSLNSHPLGTFTWDGRKGYDASAAGQASWLAAAPQHPDHPGRSGPAADPHRLLGLCRLDRTRLSRPGHGPRRPTRHPGPRPDRHGRADANDRLHHRPGDRLRRPRPPSSRRHRPHPGQLAPAPATTSPSGTPGRLPPRARLLPDHRRRPGRAGRHRGRHPARLEHRRQRLRLHRHRPQLAGGRRPTAVGAPGRPRPARRHSRRPGHLRPVQRRPPGPGGDPQLPDLRLPQLERRRRASRRPPRPSTSCSSATATTTSRASPAPASAT